MRFMPGTIARQGLLAACLLMLACPHAVAVLGGPVSTIESDRAMIAAQHHLSTLAATAIPVHELRTSDGSVVKEFVGPDGFVFAVRWSTRLKPRLDQLLGAQAIVYRSAAARSANAPGIRHRFVLDQGDLVVQSDMHLTAYVGIAYLRSRLPEGVHADDLR